MKNQDNLINLLLFITVALIFACNCKKDDITIVGNSFTDPRDGNVYKTVTIGNQVWMAENLKYLPTVTGSDVGSSTSPYYYVYGYNGTNTAEAKATANYKIYGVLYNWAAAMAGTASSSSNPSRVKGVSPTGWHLPSDAELIQLTKFLGGENGAGGKLKEIGTTIWNDPNDGATNSTGFTALPGGYRTVNGAFSQLQYYGYWWSATEKNADTSNYIRMDFIDAIAGRSYVIKNLGLSVRCVKD